jgi:hypothetical protein
MADLLSRFPALRTPGDENSPWVLGPEPGDVSGDFAYINMTYDGAEGAADFVAETARRHNLVCFDPQSGSLL